MIKLLVDDREVKFTTTIFPDGTSQVWKVEEELFEDNDIKILWVFENEGELMHVCQLAQLTQLLSKQPDSTLVVPYLPYGRQDKALSNSASFSLKTFVDILYSVNVCRIETFDAHSNQEELGIYSAEPTLFHQEVFHHDVVCFPDKGAAARYNKSQSFGGAPAVYCEKVRNQETGEILGLKLIGDADLNNKRILIVDDICDGGMTFIKVAEQLKAFNPLQIDLAVSHGIFSRGKGVIKEAGITNIYTTNSLPRNPESFKIW